MAGAGEASLLAGGDALGEVPGRFITFNHSCSDGFNGAAAFWPRTAIGDCADEGELRAESSWDRPLGTWPDSPLPEAGDW